MLQGIFRYIYHSWQKKEAKRINMHFASKGQPNRGDYLFTNLVIAASWPSVRRTK